MEHEREVLAIANRPGQEKAMREGFKELHRAVRKQTENPVKHTLLFDGIALVIVTICTYLMAIIIQLWI